MWRVTAQRRQTYSADVQSLPHLRSVIVVTGAAGFIGSVLVGELNALGVDQLLLVDDLRHLDRLRNLQGRAYQHLIEHRQLISFLENCPVPPELIFHLGAHTDTTEADVDIFQELNLEPSQALWKYCSRMRVPLIYASSAATYGAGEHGYRDDEQDLHLLKPLNAYGRSKHHFDRWAVAQTEAPPRWAGLKFFNVYGPNESHKSQMASVTLHAFQQIQQGGQLKLFRSHRPDVADGDQRRDFVYVFDVCAVMLWFWRAQPASGIYNVGTGQARSFMDLGQSVFAALDKAPEIEFIDTPTAIRPTYQYFTEADISKLRAAGYEQAFLSLEAGVHHYITEFLLVEAEC